MIHDRKRVERIRDAVNTGLERVSHLHHAIDDPDLHENLELVQHLLEHVDEFCLRLAAKEQQGSPEQESRWLDNADSMIDMARKQTDAMERIFKVYRMPA